MKTSDYERMLAFLSRMESAYDHMYSMIDYDSFSHKLQDIRHTLRRYLDNSKHDKYHYM